MGSQSCTKQQYALNLADKSWHAEVRLVEVSPPRIGIPSPAHLLYLVDGAVDGLVHLHADAVQAERVTHVGEDATRPGVRLLRSTHHVVVPARYLRAC